ncbi:MAG: anchored repeat ABC transporter, substrate-binding protein [Microbacteriaceae bacterium]|nr:anchored repeat ABC transporter, substrate-binding protein [Microbacteriaceae bacterium]
MARFPIFARRDTSRGVNHANKRGGRLRARLGAGLNSRSSTGLRTKLRAFAACAALACLALSGCAPTAGQRAEGAPLRVVTTTGILADIVRNVAGEHATVSAIVPDGADPHSYEPKLRDVRDVVYADAAFSNYLMLEEQKIIKMLDANLRQGVPNVALAEAATKYAADVIPLVENVSLDAPWLGLRVLGKGEKYGANRGSQVTMKATGAKGPGHVFAYLTDSFGEVEKYFDSSDGFKPAEGYRGDSVNLPPDAHTHLSWAFSEPGYYALDLSAELQVKTGAKPVPLGNSVLYFAVGVDPHGHPDVPGAKVVSEGHADYSINTDNGEFVIYQDIEVKGHDAHQHDHTHDHSHDYSQGNGHSHSHGNNRATTQKAHQTIAHDPRKTVVEVPAKVRAQIPGEPQFRFLGRPGAPIYTLPQAVLGKHVHGEIDPHLWHNVRNVIAYTQAVRDTLINVDSKNAVAYRENADKYIAKLNELDGYVAAKVREIPAAKRLLVTTHDAYAYLAHAYGLKVVGFVTPNPAVEPSVADRKKLSTTMQTLKVPAVFIEPNLAKDARTLQEIAAENGVEVCRLYSDAFDKKVNTYIDLMRRNAEELVRCLR